MTLAQKCGQRVMGAAPNAHAACDSGNPTTATNTNTDMSNYDNTGCGGGVAGGGLWRRVGQGEGWVPIIIVRWGQNRLGSGCKGSQRGCQVTPLLPHATVGSSQAEPRRQQLHAEEIVVDSWAQSKEGVVEGEGRGEDGAGGGR